MRTTAWLIFLALSLSLTTPARSESPPYYHLKWGHQGSLPGELYRPQGLAATPSGDIYVADTGNNRIQLFDGKGILLNLWGSTGSSPGQFNFPVRVAVGPTGDVYVADSGNNRIQKFTAGGAFLLEWGMLGSDPGEFTNPFGVAVAADGSVYVAEAANNRIQKFDANGTFLLQWGGPGGGPGKFDSPWSVAVDPQGNVYVSDTFNDRVQKFDANGGFITMWGPFAGDRYVLRQPQQIAADNSGHIYVCSSYKGRIMKFTTSGAFVVGFGFEGGVSAWPPGNGEISSPLGVAVDSEDYVYVTDTDFSRIEKFAQPPHDDSTPKILLHLGPAGVANPCNAGRPTQCSQAVTRGSVATGDGPFYNLYVVMSRGYMETIAGVQFGIEYESNLPASASNKQGVDIFSWAHCGTLQFPMPGWPAPGTGNLITWNYLTNCQTNDLTVAGYFYMGAYSEDRMSLVPRSADDLGAFGSCNAAEIELGPEDFGFVTFSRSGTVPGCNPCLVDCSTFGHPVLVRTVTWSRIKTLYK